MLFNISRIFSDILLCLFCLPFTPMYTLLDRWIFGTFMCHMVPFAQGKMRELCRKVNLIEFLNIFSRVLCVPLYAHIDINCHRQIFRYNFSISTEDEADNLLRNNRGHLAGGFFGNVSLRVLYEIARHRLKTHIMRGGLAFRDLQKGLWNHNCHLAIHNPMPSNLILLHLHFLQTEIQQKKALQDEK